MKKKKIRVLLVEKEPDYSDKISEILARHYGEVDLDRETRFPLARDLEGNLPDVILVDPFENGSGFEESIAELKTLYPKIPVVFITENKTPELIIEGFRMGITDYLLKPFRDEEFIRMFQRVLFALQSRQLPALEGIFQVCQQLNLCRSIKRFFYILSLYIAKTLTSRQFVVLYKEPQAEKFDVLHAVGILKANEKKLRRLVSRGGMKFLEIREILTFVMSEQLPQSFQNILGKDENYLFVTFGNEGVGEAILGFEIGHRPREFIIPLFPKVEELLYESEIIFSNLMAFLKAREIALKDDVTGFYNMRSFKSLVGSELKEADERRYPVSALFLDIDNFKRVNDVHGHLTGTKVLQEVGEVLRDVLRQGELVFRYGGDEFVVILPGIDLEQAMQIGERIRLSVARYSFQKKEGKKIHLTISIGVATYPKQAKNLTELLAFADEAMYHGKKYSKNVVYVAGSTVG